jgi:dihydroorotate dehydrogenase
MGLYDRIVRPVAFRFDPEKIHEVALSALRKGVFQTRPFQNASLAQELFGVRFPNPLGLAAGFDKNAVALNYWDRLGFGFVECGTVTYHAQDGNPKPRMFRLPEDLGLINRLGFNNLGAREIATNVASAKSKIPVGINIGKSRVTAVEAAAGDYAESYRLLHRFGDYFAINVSSPNTPGLRTLQEKGPLMEIIARLKEIDAAKPLFVKVSPDLETGALDDVVEVAHEMKLTGLIATNTTLARDSLGRDPQMEGGLSGRPLKSRADELLGRLYKSCGKELVLIGVGGIFTGEDLYQKIQLGAHLCQVYTGWIYAGPHMVPDCLESLVALMERDGFATLAEARGTAR